MGGPELYKSSWWQMDVDYSSYTPASCPVVHLNAIDSIRQAITINDMTSKGLTAELVAVTITINDRREAVFLQHSQIKEAAPRVT
jgi:hypothetical protein